MVVLQQEEHTQTQLVGMARGQSVVEIGLTVLLEVLLDLEALDSSEVWDA